MSQILTTADEQPQEFLNLKVDDPDLDFVTAKQIAKDKAFERCDHPMILSWKKGKTGESFPNRECGQSDTPVWIRYAESRGANLTVDINGGDYVFMILKM